MSGHLSVIPITSIETVKLPYMDLLVVMQTEERVEDQVGGTVTHCHSGRVVSAVGETRPEAP